MSAVAEHLSIQQRARLFPCRREHGGCGAQPGEFCVTGRGRKSYTVHVDRLEQENDAWKQVHNQPDHPASQVITAAAADLREGSGT